MNYRRFEDDARSETSSRPSTRPNSVVSTVYCCLLDLRGECLREWEKTNLIPIILMILEVTLCVAFIFTSHSETDPDAPQINDSVVEYLLTAYMVIGTIGMLLCFRKRKRKSFVMFVDNQEKSSKYLISGVYAFGGGNLFIIVLHIFAFAHCSEDASHYVFNTFRFLFTLTQMLFLQKFSSASFFRQKSIVLLLFHILGTDVCIWAFFVIEETNLLPTAHHDLKHEHCLNESGVTVKLQDLDQYAIPFNLEFCIISAGLIYAMVTYMSFYQKGPMAPGQKECCSTACSSLTTESRFQHENDRGDRKPYTTSYPGFLLGLSVGVVMTVSELTLKSQGKVSESMIFHHSLITVVYATQIIALLVVTRSLTSCVHVKKRFKADEILLIISFVGIVSWNFLCLIGSASGVQRKNWSFSNPSMWKKVSISIVCDNLVDIIQTSLQTVVIVRTLKFRNEFREDAKLALSPKKVIKEMNRLQQVLAYLLMTNVSFWGLNSFFELTDSKLYYPVTNDYFKDHWHLFSSLLFPFNVFFRFHSSALLYEIMVRFQYYPDDRIHCDDDQHENIASRMRSSSLPMPRETDLFGIHFVTSKREDWLK